jgi:hypothetical protein
MIDTEVRYQIISEDSSSDSVQDLYIFPADMDYDSALGMYYKDIQVKAPPPTLPLVLGEEYDLSRGDQLTLDDSDVVYYGYHLSNDNSVLAFSVQENLMLNVSAWFLADDATNILGDAGTTAGRRYLTGESSFTMNYRYCSATAQTQDFLTSTTNRIVLADHLARAAFPEWVVGNIQYSGGELPSIILPQLRQLIRAIRFGEYLDISVVRSLFERYGVTDFDDPTMLYTIAVDPDRNYTMAQLLNRITPLSRYHFVDDTRLSATQV